MEQEMIKKTWTYFFRILEENKHWISDHQ